MNLTTDNENITQTLTPNLLNNPTQNKKKKNQKTYMCAKGHILKVLRLLWYNSCRIIFAKMMWYSSAPRSENWAISFRITFSSQTWQHVSLENKLGNTLPWEIHEAVGTKLMEHLTMSYVFIRGDEGKEIPSHQSTGSLFSIYLYVDFLAQTQPSPWKG